MSSSQSAVVMTVHNYGNDGGESVSIVAWSRMSEASAASSGEKLSISKKTSKPWPTQFAGGKKCSRSHVVFMVPTRICSITNALDTEGVRCSQIVISTARILSIVKAWLP